MSWLCIFSDRVHVGPLYAAFMYCSIHLCFDFLWVLICAQMSLLCLVAYLATNKKCQPLLVHQSGNETPICQYWLPAPANPCNVFTACYHSGLLFI